MNDEIEKRVIEINSKNNKYTHDEKVKYLEDAIKNGGYYGEDGTWNSIKVFDNDNHIYRLRVETLIIKDNDFIFLKFLHSEKRSYLVPGGSTEKDIPNVEQAINECKEEAKILVKNIQSTGITYKDYNTPPAWAIKSQPVNWNGTITEIYVAEYDKKYTGKIDKVDEDKFMATGKFYKLDTVFKYLNKEHKEALKLIYPDRFTNINNHVEMENATNKKERETILNDVIESLTNAGFTPKVSEKSKDAFLNNKRTMFSEDGSTICIAGLGNNGVKRAASIVNSLFKTKNITGKAHADNYGTIFVSLGSDIITEKALTTEERKAIPSSEFGIPSLRKFPLHDKCHVIQAIKDFNAVDRKHEKELARNIIKVMKRYGIDKSIVGPLNRLSTYVK